MSIVEFDEPPLQSLDVSDTERYKIPVGRGGGPSIKPGTWNIPEHSGTFRNIPEHPGTSNNYDNYEKKCLKLNLGLLGCPFGALSLVA